MRYRIEIVSLFHDTAVELLLLVIGVVLLSFFLVIKTQTFIRVDAHKLEFVWTVAPSVLLLVLAAPSLFALYAGEWGDRNQSAFVKGYQ
jgi:heme/copper-type cytochrome/quinol oxidase subunit 2